MIYTILDENGQTISFDCVTNASYSSTVNITEHPVETKSPVTDHAYEENDKFSITGVVSDFNFFNPNRGVFGSTVYFDNQGLIVANTSPEKIQDGIKNALIFIQKSKKRFTLVLGSKPDEKLESHTNCMINQLTINDSPENGESLMVSLSIVKVRVVNTVVDTVSKLPELLKVEVAKKDEKGAQPAVAQEAIDAAKELNKAKGLGDDVNKATEVVLKENEALKLRIDALEKGATAISSGASLDSDFSENIRIANQ